MLVNHNNVNANITFSGSKISGKTGYYRQPTYRRILGSLSAPTLLTGFLFLASTVFSVSVHATEIYIYENQYGEKLFADRPLQKTGYRLIRRQGPRNEATSPSSQSPSSQSTSGAHKRSTGNKLTSFKERAKRYDEYIAWAANSYQLDPALIKAVIHVESAFDPNATSRVGAQGLMQLMPATARDNGVTNSYNPKQNIMGGSKFLRYLMDKYDGNITMVLAAYNAGESRVRQYNGIPPFKETQNYVKKVIRLHQKYAEALDA